MITGGWPLLSFKLLNIYADVGSFFFESILHGGLHESEGLMEG